MPDGFGDLSFLLKYHFLTNEEKGNYIFTAFLSASLPTGSHTNGALDSTITPTLAAGVGAFDLTSTFGAILPVDETQKIGRQVVWNSVAQYRFMRKTWPQAEVNYTYFSAGPNNGNPRFPSHPAS